MVYCVVVSCRLQPGVLFFIELYPLFSFGFKPRPQTWNEHTVSSVEIEDYNMLWVPATLYRRSLTFRCRVELLVVLSLVRRDHLRAVITRFMWSMLLMAWKMLMHVLFYGFLHAVMYVLVLFSHIQLTL